MPLGRATNADLFSRRGHVATVSRSSTCLFALVYAMAALYEVLIGVVRRKKWVASSSPPPAVGSLLALNQTCRGAQATKFTLGPPSRLGRLPLLDPVPPPPRSALGVPSLAALGPALDVLHHRQLTANH